MDMHLHENNIGIGNIVAEIYVLDALITVKTETAISFTFIKYLVLLYIKGYME